MFKFIFIILFLFSLFGCGNFRQADFDLSSRIGGENARDARFAIFGAASLKLNQDDPDDRLAMVIIASDNENLCAEFNNNFNGFLTDLSEGDVPGVFVITFVDVFGKLENNRVFIGKEEEDLVIDPRFIVSNGAGVEVDSLDVEAEGKLKINKIENKQLSGELSVRLNQDKSGFFANSINVQMDGELFLVPECDIISEVLKAGLENQVGN